MSSQLKHKYVQLTVILLHSSSTNFHNNLIIGNLELLFNAQYFTICVDCYTDFKTSALFKFTTIQFTGSGPVKFTIHAVWIIKHCTIHREHFIILQELCTIHKEHCIIHKEHYEIHKEHCNIHEEHFIINKVYIFTKAMYR